MSDFHRPFNLRQPQGYAVNTNSLEDVGIEYDAT